MPRWRKVELYLHFLRIHSLFTKRWLYRFYFTTLGEGLTSNYNFWHTTCSYSLWRKVKLGFRHTPLLRVFAGLRTYYVPCSTFWNGVCPRHRLLAVPSSLSALPLTLLEPCFWPACPETLDSVVDSPRRNIKISSWCCVWIPFPSAPRRHDRTPVSTSWGLVKLHCLCLFFYCFLYNMLVRCLGLWEWKKILSTIMNIFVIIIYTGWVSR